MFDLFLKDDGGDGTLAEVWIDKEANLCKKFYKTNSITVKNRHPLWVPENNSFEIIKYHYLNEVNWSTKLKSKFILELYDHGELPNNNGFYILQEYIGPDLLIQDNNYGIYNLYPDLDDQLEEMFAFFQQHDIYKFNHAFSNLTGANGKIKSFDFKHALNRRPEFRKNEIMSLEKWINPKVNLTLMPKLIRYI